MLDRQQQLLSLQAAQSIVCRWAIRLGRGDRQRTEWVLSYLSALAQIECGLLREVRTSRADGLGDLVLVDEFAEALHAVRRPPIAVATERRIGAELRQEVHRAIQRASHG